LIKKNTHPIAGTSVVTRDTTPVPAKEQALSGIRRESLYSCPFNVGQLRFSYSWSGYYPFWLSDNRLSD